MCQGEEVLDRLAREILLEKGDGLEADLGEAGEL